MEPITCSIVVTSTVVAGSILMVMALRAAYKAATYRKPDVRFWDAFGTFSLCFCSWRYEPPGLEWAVVHIKYCMAFLAVVGGSWLLLFAITGKPSGNCNDLPKPAAPVAENRPTH